MFKKTILISLLAAAGVTFAADYYVVVPVQGKQAKPNSIYVVLNSTPLPTGVVGVPYAGFDLSTALQASGDPGFNASLATFAVTSGTLPAGLTLSAAGVLSGTPTAATAGAPIQVTASYKTVTGAQAYQVIVANLNVSLASATLPVGLLGVAYNAGSGFDFKSVLSAPADPGFNASLATFSVASGTLPTGLNLSATGVLTGTPSQLTANAGADLTVATSYKGNPAQQTFKVPVRGFSSCDAVLAAKPGAPSGLYYLDFDGAGPGSAAQYHCDMTPEGQGWLRLNATNAAFSTAVSAQGEVSKAFVPVLGCASAQIQFSVNNLLVPATKIRMDLTRSTVSQCSFLADTGGSVLTGAGAGASLTGTAAKYWNGSTYQPLSSSCSWSDPNWATVSGAASIAGLPTKFRFFADIPASKTVGYTGSCSVPEDNGIFAATVFVR